MNTNHNTNSKTDISALVAAARSGDQNAFSALYEAVNQDVYRSVRAVLRSEELALDIQQDAFVYAFSHLDQLDDPAKFRAWVRSIAVNQAKTALRKQTPVLFSELENEDGEGLPEQADLSPDASPELNLERKETARLVNEILDGLSAGQRAAVGMYYYEQMSIAEISESLGVASSTVKNQLVRGRKKIEEAVRALEKRGVKLYGLSPISFLLALMKQQSLPVRESEAVLAKTLAQAGIAAGTKAAASAAAPVVLHATKPFFSTVIGKVVLGVAAAGVIVGGAAGYRWARNNLFEKTAPILMVDSSEDLQNDPTAPTMPVDVDVTGPTVPVERDATAENLVTEPVVTEPETTEPATTEPAATEPVATEAPVQDEYSGTCGANLTWRFDPSAGLLTIEGSGAMDDAVASTEKMGQYDAPWHRFQSQISSVRLPDGLTRIGSHCFDCCTSLSQVTIPEGVTVIGSCAFESCTALQSVELPASLTEIGSNAFLACGMYEITIPDGVTSIGTNAFAECENLSSLKIGSGVTSIGDYAFDTCSSLLRAVIPSSVESIGKQAFGYQFGMAYGFTVLGYEGSAAERYASENGFRFVSMRAAELADVLAQVDRDDAERAALTDLMANDFGGRTCVVGVEQIDNRYLATVERSVSVTATEAELQQAKEDGYIVLKGNEFAYAETPERLAELIARDVSDVDMESPYGAIVHPYEIFYVYKVGDLYIFCKELGGVTKRLEEITDRCSVYLDGNMPLFEGPGASGDSYTLESYLQDHSITKGTIERNAETGSHYIYVDLR